MWEAVKLLAFPSSCMAECGFSTVIRYLIEQRSRLQIVKKSDLRLLSDIEPKVNELAIKYQVLPSDLKYKRYENIVSCNL